MLSHSVLIYFGNFSLFQSCHFHCFCLKFLGFLIFSSIKQWTKNICRLIMNSVIKKWTLAYLRSLWKWLYNSALVIKRDANRCPCSKQTIRISDPIPNWLWKFHFMRKREHTHTSISSWQCVRATASLLDQDSPNAFLHESSEGTQALKSSRVRPLL